MQKKELNQRMRNRIFIDEILEKIKEIDLQIKSYSECMEDSSFNESNEVEELYNKLRCLGLELCDIKH